MRIQKMTIPEKALQLAVQIANDQTHGYSQQNRWGPDFDCSSLVLHCYKKAGADIGNATYTGNMSDLLKHGFKEVTSSVNLNTGSGLQKGDILFYHKSGNIGHTAMCAGNGKIVHARGQSYGSAKTGDQGTEIAVTPYYRGSWQHVYRYVGGSTASAAPATVPTVKRYPVTANLPILRYGSTGRLVKIWQTIIGVEADGEFGKNTLAATLQFQRASDLEDDGEVGPLTWGAGLKVIE